MRPDVLAEHLAVTIRGLVSPLALRVAALETGAGELGGIRSVVSEVRERLAVLEAREPIPGPPGPPGPPGAPGLRYLGVHVAGKTYDVGDLVTHGGSAWYCNETTTAAPGASSDWQLMVKRGRDARGDR